MKFFRHSNGFFTLLAGLGLVLGGLLTGCAGGSDSGGSPGGGATQTGTVAVLLTDSPSSDFSEVNVTVNEVILLSESQSPVTIFSGARRVNLWDLEEVEDLFMIHEGVPAGTYNKIRLQVSNPTTKPEKVIQLVADGKVDLVPRSPFSVTVGGALTIRLDLDVENSIPQTSSGEYLLRPVVFVDILSELPARLVRVSGVIEEINPDTRSFLLRRTDPKFYDLGDGDENRPRLIRVEVPADARIFDPSRLPGDFASDFSSLAKDQHVHVRGLLSIQGGLHIEASLIEIGDQFRRLHGLITSALDSQKHFGFHPDPGQGITNDIVVRVYDETLTFGDLMPEKRAVVEGVLDANLLHAAVIVIKLDLRGFEGTICDPKPDRTFNLTLRQSPSECSPPVLPDDMPVQVEENALIIRIGREEDNHLQIERILFDSLMNGDEAHVFGHFDESFFPFHALEVITFATQPIP